MYKRAFDLWIPQENVAALQAAYPDVEVAELLYVALNAHFADVPGWAAIERPGKGHARTFTPEQKRAIRRKYNATKKGKIATTLTFIQNEYAVVISRVTLTRLLREK